MSEPRWIALNLRREAAEGPKWHNALLAAGLSAALLGNEAALPPAVEAAPVVRKSSATDDQALLEELLSGGRQHKFVWFGTLAISSTRPRAGFPGTALLSREFDRQHFRLLPFAERGSCGSKGEKARTEAGDSQLQRNQHDTARLQARGGFWGQGQSLRRPVAPSRHSAPSRRPATLRHCQRRLAAWRYRSQSPRRRPPSPPSHRWVAGRGTLVLWRHPDPESRLNGISTRTAQRRACP